jgi:hypothetical protein
LTQALLSGSFRRANASRWHEGSGLNTRAFTFSASRSSLYSPPRRTSLSSESSTQVGVRARRRCSHAQHHDTVSRRALRAS